MGKFLSDHFGGLLRFSGREGIRSFWIWTAIILAAQLLLSFAVALPMMAETFGKIEKFAAEHPDQVTRTVGPGSYQVQIHGNHPELMPDFSSLFPVMWLGVVSLIVLLGAAVVRRLHDSNRSGTWGLLPLPFLAASMVLMPKMFSDLSGGKDPDMGTFFALFINNMVYLGALAVVVVLLARPSTPGDNRFGPPPA